ncbi:MAG: hypothetical protein LQ347_004351 [Umbilicaria vellea]|nr:MAG: hypothetical protein LQ347_004351 [Umbilicaria vellea]
MTTPNELRALQEVIWNGSLPLEIRLSPSESRNYDQTDPYLVHYPRLSYLPFLLPRLHAFFTASLITPDVSPSDAWFSFEGVPLKWHYPVGLLYDLFSGRNPSQAAGRKPLSDDDPGEAPKPWTLIVHFSDWPDEQLVKLDAEGKVLHDAFINSVKEADFLRNGTAKGIMSLSKDDSTRLWDAVLHHQLFAFAAVSQKLLYAQAAPLRHVPLKVYLPASPSASQPTAGHLRVVQSLVTPCVPNTREPQTLGSALHGLLPSLFPSRRTPILAKPVLHGAVVPMGALLEELLRVGAYLDGWVHLGVVMMG